MNIIEETKTNERENKDIGTAEICIPNEIEKCNMMHSIPKFAYIRNEEHFIKNKYRKSSYKRSLLFKDNDENSSDSHTTNKAMPSLSNPKEFRLKNYKCKTSVANLLSY